MSGFPADGMSKAVKWLCKKCGHENKADTAECRSCGHEPVLGRRDHEALKWAASHRDDES